MPSSTAGIPLDDRYVLAGGKLERTRAQLEWSPMTNVLLLAFAERQRIDNLYSDLVGVLNNRPDSSNLERLRNRSFTPLAGLEPLEGFAVVSRGRFEERGLTANVLVTRHVALFAATVHAKGENTNPQFAGAALAFTPRDRHMLGASWFSDDRWTVSARAVRRGERFIDEANSGRLPAEWSGAVQAYWETVDKRFSVELVAAGIAAKSQRDAYGVTLNWRF